MLVKKLHCGLKKSGGRNNTGRTTVYTKSGGHKRNYRYIDFKRNLVGIPAKVISILYDPNRGVDIALIAYTNGVLSYILKPNLLKVGDYVMSGKNNIFGNTVSRVGSVMMLRDINEGEIIHNLEMYPNKGGIFGRTGGAALQVLKKYEHLNKVLVRMPSKEFRLFSMNCRATIGELGNSDNNLKVIGKAGISRWLGKKPIVRGVAMNPVDHPHGGNTSGGRPSVTPWSRITKGQPTRNKRKSSLLIIKKRKK